MDVVTLVRDQVFTSSTRGILLAKDKRFYTMERPWLNNQNDISCIPAGMYHVKYLERSYSGTYRNVFHIQNVPGRYGVLIHNGNIATQSKGCILIGMGRAHFSGVPAVTSSRIAKNRFADLMCKSEFMLNVVWASTLPSTYTELNKT